MKVVFYLKSCNTCTRIIKEIKLDSSFEFREIKSKPLSTEEIEMIYSLSKNYELIFNKRAKLFSEKKLKNVTLTELEYKNYILDKLATRIKNRNLSFAPNEVELYTSMLPSIAIYKKFYRSYQ